jgi:hypothetical protein
MRVRACSMMGLRSLVVLLLMPLLWPATSAQRQNVTMTIPELEALLANNTWEGPTWEDGIALPFQVKLYQPDHTFAFSTRSHTFGLWNLRSWGGSVILETVSCISSSHIDTFQYTSDDYTASDISASRPGQVVAAGITSLIKSDLCDACLSTNQWPGRAEDLFANASPFHACKSTCNASGPKVPCWLQCAWRNGVSNTTRMMGGQYSKMNEWPRMCVEAEDDVGLLADCSKALNALLVTGHLAGFPSDCDTACSADVVNGGWFDEGNPLGTAILRPASFDNYTLVRRYSIANVRQYRPECFAAASNFSPTSPVPPPPVGTPSLPPPPPPPPSTPPFPPPPVGTPSLPPPPPGQDTRPPPPDVDPINTSPPPLPVQLPPPPPGAATIVSSALVTHVLLLAAALWLLLCT